MEKLNKVREEIEKTKTFGFVNGNKEDEAILVSRKLVLYLIDKLIDGGVEEL